MCGEGVDESDSCMRVVRNSGGGGWNDGAKFDGDVETEGRPVSITGVDSFLVLAHSIDLNIGLSFTDEGRALPGYNVFDVVIGKSTKNDDVASEKWLVVPADGVDVNAV